MEERAGAGDAADALHRRAVEVADPHGDGDLGREADGDVVAVALRGAGLGGDGERELEHAVLAERREARVAVGEDVGDDERRRGDRARGGGSRGASAIGLPSLPTARFDLADDDPGMKHAAAGERGVGVGELEQAHLAVAEREGERRSARRRRSSDGEAELVEALEHARGAERDGGHDGGHVERVAEGLAEAHRAVEAAVVVVRVVVAVGRREVRARRRGAPSPAVKPSALHREP